MANYFVTYDLNGPTPSHSTMDKHMEKAGWARGRVLETVWYVGTADALDSVYNHVASILSEDDQVLVIEVRGAHWNNLLVTDTSLKEQWAVNS